MIDTLYASIYGLVKLAFYAAIFATTAENWISSWQNGCSNLLKLLGHNLHISAIAGLVKALKIDSRNYYAPPTFSEMEKFPGFLPAYRHYGFQIHGEGHTHLPLQKEPNIENEQQHPSTLYQFWYLA